MGSLKTLALAGAMAVSASALANAADYPYAPPPPPPPHEPLGLKGSISSGIYLRGDVGVGQLKVKKYDQLEVRNAGGTFFGETDNHSVFAGVGIGYRFNNWFRVDGTFEYRGASSIGVNDLVRFQTGFGQAVQTNTYKGNLSSYVAMFNGYVDLGTWHCLTPYIGVGIGYAANRISGLTDQGVQSIAGGAGTGTLGYATSGDKSGLAWALMAGVGYEVNKNLTLEVGYRYLNLGEAHSGRIQNAFIAQNLSPLRAKEIDSHDIKIGMRWNFGEPECCGPTERPVAYAPAPHVVRKY
jgi:opacity protein-like surface antigen